MKDIIQKLTELEATAPKTSKKKMLKEDSATPPMNAETKPTRLKDIFETMVSGQPIPVVGKQGDTQQTGAGFLNMTDTSPAAQALGKAVGDLVGQKKLQIVVPNQPGGAKPGQPAPAGATGQQPAGQMQMKEKWDAETKVAPSEKGKYAGKDKAELTKAYNKLKASGPYKKGSPEFGKMRELAFAIRAKSDWGKVQEEEQLDEKFASQQQAKLMYATAGGADTGVSKKVAKEFIKKSHGQKVGKLPKKKTDEADIPSTNGIDTMGAGLGAGRSQTTLEAKEPQVEVIDNAFNRENYKDLIGKKYPKSKAPAYARVKEISEGQLNELDPKTLKNYRAIAKGQLRDMASLEPSFGKNQDQSKDRENRKAKRLKGLNMADKKLQDTLEEAKPDFLDLDKDGNKKEPMKKAAADKKQQKVNESMNHRISAARLEGKSHGLRGHAHSGKRYEDLEELKAYHEGYKEGLDECYGQGVYEGLAGTAGGAIAGGMLGGPLGALAGGLLGSEISKESAPATPPATVSGMANAAMEADMDEGNAFTGALAKTPKGGKFSVGGKTFTDTSSLEEYAFESMDLDEAVFNPMGGVARELRGLKGIVKDTPHAQLPGVMGAGAGAAVGIPAAATAGAVGAAFLPIIGASALGGYGLLKAGQLTGKVLNFLAQKLFGTKEEALAFTKAHLAAAKSGETSFQHNGKTYKVSLKPGQVAQLQHDIDDLTSQIKNKEFDKRMAPDTTMGKIGAALKEDPVFESWDRELSNLLNENEEVTEGLSVSVSKGQQNSPDSVTITAQDHEADELLKLVKSAGLGLFADEEPAQSMSVQPDHGEPHEIGTGGVDIDVVDGDDMLSLIKKMGGVEAAGAEDYADEEDCGCKEETHEAGCSMGKGKEMVDEVESEDQMEFEVAEDNAPDSEEAEHTADEDAEAQEDAALAKAAQQDKTTTVNEGGDGGEASEEGPESKEGETDEEGETVSESFANLFKKLEMIAEESTAEKDDKAEKAGKKVAKDIEYDEGHKGKDDNKAEKAGKEVKKDIEYDDKKDKKEKVDEWANNAGPGKTVSDTTFEQDIEFMTKVIAGGLNKPKSTGQTTIPVIAGQDDRMHDNPQDWATLAGIKK